MESGKLQAYVRINDTAHVCCDIDGDLGWRCAENVDARCVHVLWWHRVGISGIDDMI